MRARKVAFTPALSWLVLLLCSILSWSCDGTVDCTEHIELLPIKVVDEVQQPIGGATVVATNLLTGKVMSGSTAADGTTIAISESIGGGKVSIIASHGGTVSVPAEVNWRCDECHCVPNSEGIVLVLPEAR